MDASQNSGNGQKNQNNNEKKAQLSWSQPLNTNQVKPAQNSPIGSGEPRTNFASASATVGMPKQARVNEMEKGKPHMMRNLSIAVVVILILGGIAWSLGGKKSSTSTVASDTTGTSQTTGSVSGTMPAGTVVGGTSPAMFPNGSLVVASPQTAGLEVAVSSIIVQVPTWVVIYENFNGQPGNVLGAALFTSTRSSGVVDLLRGTLPGQTYFAGEARDDGDHMFSMVNDPAVRDENGNPTVLKFQTK